MRSRYQWIVSVVLLSGRWRVTARSYANGSIAHTDTGMASTPDLSVALSRAVRAWRDAVIVVSDGASHAP